MQGLCNTSDQRFKIYYPPTNAQVSVLKTILKFTLKF